MTRAQLLKIAPNSSEGFIAANTSRDDSRGILAQKNHQYEADPECSLPYSIPQHHKAKPLGKAVSRKETGDKRTVVSFVGHRVRPLDPDNFAGSVKDLLDGLRHAQIISGDEPWKIILKTEQVKVRSFKEEKTVIEVIYK